MRISRWLLPALLTAIQMSAQGAESIPVARLDAYFDALEANQLANGSIVISEKGVVRYRRSVGFAVIDPQRSIPSDAGTRYKIGSVTQLFTAAMAMQLVEQASITLDSKLAEFYPELPNALAITYRDLLQHRSGLSNYSETPGFEQWRTEPRSHADLLKMIAAGGARFPPRDHVEYNDSNYLLMGYVLEKVYERPYAAILQRQIVDKLGLSRTYYGTFADPAQHESVSYAYQPQGWVAQKQTDPGLHGGAGGIVSNPEDLVQFINALFAGKLVGNQSLSTMRDQAGGSGIGLWNYEISGQTGFGHRGAIEGYRDCVYYFPARGLAVAYASNAVMLPMAEIVDETLATVFERGHKPLTFAAPALTTRQQDAFVGTWRSAPGTPKESPHRQFKAPDQPIELAVSVGTDGLTGNVQGHDFKLAALGEDEFLIREIGYFLRFYPRSDELVVRGGDFAYYLKRGE